MSMCRVLVCHRRSAIITDISDAMFFFYKICSFWTKNLWKFWRIQFLLLIRLFFLETFSKSTRLILISQHWEKKIWVLKIFEMEKKRSNNYNLIQGVCHTVALSFTLKSILRRKKSYGNSNISPCKNIIFTKNPLKEKPKSFKIS
jgi:hypothetical protein